MDQISQIYNQMCKMSNTIQQQNISNTSIDTIILQISRHINQIILCLPKKEADILKFYSSMLTDNNRHLMQIICQDQIRFKFKILLNGYQIKFTIIPQSLIKNISNKYQKIGGFYGGSKLYPSNQIYFIFKKIQFKKKFIENRKKQLQLLKKQLQQTNIQNFNRQQSIEDIFKQYISYFRYC